MPELPEVETVVRQLARVLPGRRIRSLEVFHPDLLREPVPSFRSALVGREIRAVGRRGKNIVLSLSRHHVLAVNLGMTGRLLYQGPGREAGDQGEGSLPHSQPPLTHLAVRFLLEPDGWLNYADVRRFGSIRRFTLQGWETESRRLGPEPLAPSLTADSFHSRLRASRSPIRSWLLDQTRIAGIGNIYAVEALFNAGIHPQTPACSLDQERARTLLGALRDVLRRAIEARGTTLREDRKSVV